MRRRRFFCRLTATLVVTIFVVAARLSSQQRVSPPLLAALPFTNAVVGDDRSALNPLASGVPELLLIELARNPDIRIVEPARVRRVLTAQKLDTQARIDDETASRVGRILGAQWVVRGTLTSDGRGAIRLASYVVNVGTGQIAHSESAEGKLANLAELVGQLAEHLGRDMHLAELSRESRRSRELTQRASYETTLAFARAIEARDAGRVQQAIALLEQLLSDNPGYEPAQNELTRLHSSRAR
jgi:TolB-like protein